MGFVTTEDFANSTAFPIAMPQGKMQAGETITLATIQLDETSRLDLAWLTMHLLTTAPAIRSSLLTFASQLGFTVTANTPIFQPQDVGSFIQWEAGTRSTIVAYVSPTVVTVDVSTTLDPDYFTIVGSSPAFINSSFGLVYVGLYTQEFYRLSTPGAVPIFFLSLPNIGLASLPSRTRRIVHGPDVVTVAVTNNTTNVDDVEVTVSGVIKVYN